MIVFIVSLYSQSSLLSGLTLAPEATCHLRELELCAIGAASLFQNPKGLPVSDREFKRQCEQFRESAQCFEEYNDRCLTDTQHLMVDLFAGDVFNIERDLCTNGTELNRDYLKHAECLRDVQKKYQRTCVSDLVVGFESIHKVNRTIKLPIACW